MTIVDSGTSEVFLNDDVFKAMVTLLKEYFLVSVIVITDTSCIACSMMCVLNGRYVSSELWMEIMIGIKFDILYFYLMK